MAKKELEQALEARIKPVLEQAMHKYLGVTVSEIEGDISDKLKRPLLDFQIDTRIPFKKAKLLFRKAYFTRLLQMFLGNISEVAKVSGLDRRSVHRLIERLHIDVDTFREARMPEYIREHAVKNIIEGVFEHYKTSFNPAKLEQLYKHIGEVSKDVAKELPEKIITFKEAEDEFEKQYIEKALQENDANISQTAKKIGLRFETVHRKMKELNITQ